MTAPRASDALSGQSDAATRLALILDGASGALRAHPGRAGGSDALAFPCDEIADALRDLELHAARPGGTLTQDGLDRLASSAGRLQRLLAAARAGALDAARRIAEIRAGAGGLATYDAEGRRGLLAAGRALPARRA